MNDNRRWKEISVNNDTDVWDKETPLEGEFVKVAHDIGPNKSNMYTLRTDAGEIKVWGSTVLDDKLMGVPQGAYVQIEYEGKKPSKNGGSYHSYKVFLDEDSVSEKEDIPPEDMPEEFLRDQN